MKTLLKWSGVIVALAFVAACTSGLPDGSDLLGFAADQWKAESATVFSKEEPVTLRQKMLQDVIENVVASGDRASVIEQLGPSLDTNYFSSTGRDLVYYLGPDRSSYARIDSEWLLIWLDETGKVSKYRIAVD